MGGRGYKNDASTYLADSNKIMEYTRVYMTPDEKIEFLIDVISPSAPTLPIFSNSPNKIYVLINKRMTGLKSIGIYDEHHILKESIHLDHKHNKNIPHVHVGDAYHHSRNEGRSLTPEELKLVSDVLKIWEDLRKNNFFL